METEHVEFESLDQVMDTVGPNDCHLKAIDKAFGVACHISATGVTVSGNDPAAVRSAGSAFRILQKMRRTTPVLTSMMVDQAMELATGEGGVDADQAVEAMTDVVAVTYRGKPVKCKTIGQKNYIKAIRDNTVTICIGPAGTGKTYLAMAMAVNALKRKEISRIILTRPAVEAGERLGFLPGDLQQKVDPYLRPLYDALYDFLGQEQAHRYLETGVIEVAPLAYMRGRTLSDCLVILDEGQNATLETLKMVLTRFGEGAKVVVNGDVTQIDLGQERTSGLRQCAELLKGIESIAVVRLTNRDVVRHKLVKEIIKAFEKYEEKESKSPRPQSRPPRKRS